MPKLLITGSQDSHEDVFWGQVKIQATIAAMQSLIAVHQSPRPELIVPQAIKFADLMIQELQKNDQPN